MNIVTCAPITVESFRAVLVEERGDEVSDDYVDAFLNLSEGERFDMAKQLLPEIKSYNDNLLEDPGFSSKKVKRLNSFLLRSFEDYNGISYEDFSWLVSSPDTYSVTVYLVRNKFFPIALLLDPILLEKDQLAPHSWVLKEYVRLSKFTRKPEIVAHYRNLIPNSEHMSDEMVLSVAGVTL